jgi:hypothetical protein
MLAKVCIGSTMHKGVTVFAEEIYLVWLCVVRMMTFD